MSGYLQLGPVSFQDFELPGQIRFGGKQRLAVHVLPGGTRVIDALGRDDGDIGWSGTFSSADAADRARAIDLMRVQGAVWTLAWDAFCYLVVIDGFDATYERVNWVPYRISCKVVRDLAQTIAVVVESVATGVLGDLGVAGAVSPGTAGYAGAIAAVGAVVAQAQAGISSAGASLMAAQDPATAATAAGQLATAADANGYAGRALENLDNLEA